MRPLPAKVGSFSAIALFNRFCTLLMDINSSLFSSNRFNDSARWNALYRIPEDTRSRLLQGYNPLEVLMDPNFIPPGTDASMEMVLADAFYDRVVDTSSSRAAISSLWDSMEGPARQEYFEYMAGMGGTATPARTQTDDMLNWMAQRDQLTMRSNLEGIDDERRLLLENRSSMLDLLSDDGYNVRPGLLPIAALVDTAERELRIDIYQFQNERAIDMVGEAVERMAGSGQGGRVVVRMAAPSETDGDSRKNYDILGPNIMFYKRLSYLRDRFGSNVDIDIQWADRRNHPKFFVSDRAALIGTMNVTRPLGQSLEQAGSNVEFTRTIRTNLTYSQIQDADRGILPDIITRADKLYLQARDVMDRLDGGDRVLFTGQDSIGGAGDVNTALRRHIGELINRPTIDGKTGRLYMVLNQVFLLKHDKTLMASQLKGEMGENPKHERTLSGYQAYMQAREQEYSKLQANVLDLVIEGRARIGVDVHTYREDVQDPMSRLLLSNQKLAAELSQSNYDVARWIKESRGTDVSDMANVLSTYGFYSRDLDGRQRMARQLLAIASGNIEPTAVPRSHVKAYLATYENDVINQGAGPGMQNINNRQAFDILGGSQGSSNYGLNSLADNDDPLSRRLVNQEINIIYDRVGGTSLLSLSDEERDEENREYARAFYKLQSSLGIQRIGETPYNGRDRRSMYGNRVDRGAILDLISEIERVNAAVGSEIIGVQRDYDGLNLEGATLTLNKGLPTQRVYRWGAYKNASGRGPAAFIDISGGRQIESAELFNTGTMRMELAMERDGLGVGLDPRRRLRLNPLDVVVGLMSSIALESETTRLVRAPLMEYQRYYSPDNIRAAQAVQRDPGAQYQSAMNFFEKLLGVSGLDLTTDEGTSRVQQGLSNLTSLFYSSDPDLDRIRDLASISRTDSRRRVAFEELSNIFLTYARSVDERGLPIIDLEAHRRGALNLAANKLYEIMDQGPMFADVLFKFIESQNDSRYKTDVRERLKEIHDSAFAAFLTPTQARNYGSTQASNRLLAYGFGQGRQPAGISIVNAALRRIKANETAFSNLSAFAYTASPLPIGPVSDLGVGDDFLFVRVAEGNIDSTATDESQYFTGYSNVLPLSRRATASEVFDLSIIRSTGVGDIIRRDELSEYMKAVSHLGIDRSLLEAEFDARGDNLLRFFFDPNKPDQVPQRLKNVIGMRPLMDISEGYTQVLELVSPTNTGKVIPELTPVRYQARYGGSDVDVLQGSMYQDAYLADLRAGLDARGLDSSIVDDSYRYGAIFSGRISRFMSSEAAVELEAIRYELADRLGIDSEDIPTEDDSVLAELFRATIVQSQLFASRERGLIGSGRARPTVMIMALEGAYSDYAYANPLHRVRRGFLDQATKSSKASLLGRDWTFDNVLVSSDDRIVFDEREQRYYLLDREGRRKQAITSRSEMRVFLDQIESTSRNPNMGAAMATSAAAGIRGEYAIEQLLQVSRLTGSDATNEVQVQIQFLRTLLEGGSRRVEAERGLAKIVPVFLSEDIMRSEVFPTIQQGGYHSALEIEDIQYIISPTNLKSYAFNHGATLLTYNGGELFRRGVLERNDQQIAAALLSITDSRLFSNNSNINIDSVYIEIAQLAAQGRLGNYYRDLYMSTMLELMRSDKLGDNPPHLEIGKKLVRGSDGAINRLQSPVLGAIDISEIMTALRSGTSSGALSDKVGLIVDAADAARRGYVDTGVMGRGFERAAIAGNLEIMMQLMSLNNTLELKTTPVTGSDSISRHAYAAMSAIAGVTQADEISVGQENVAVMLDRLSNYSRYVVLYNAVMGSSSKVPLSSKDTAQLEMQHIVSSPFMANVDKFKRDGSVDSMRRAILGVMKMAIGADPNKIAVDDIPMYNLASLDFHANSTLGEILLGAYNDARAPLSDITNLREQYRQFHTALSLLESASDTDMVSYTGGSGLNTTNVTHTILDEIATWMGQPAGTDRDTLRNVVRQSLRVLKNDIYAHASRWRLAGDKVLGVEATEATVQSMGQKGLRRIAYEFPSFRIEGNNVVFNTTIKDRGFILSPEDVRIAGIQFGSHENEIAAATVDKWIMLAPGSAVRDIFEKVAIESGSRTTVELEGLSDFQIQELTRFQELNNTYEARVYNDLASAYLQSITGNKIGVTGTTGVGAASWYVPVRGAVLAEATMERFGTRGSQTREEILTRLGDHLKNNLSVIGQSGDKRIGRRLIQQQIYAITEGLSIAGMYGLEAIVDKSKNFQSRAAGIRKLAPDSQAAEYAQLEIEIKVEMDRFSSMKFSGSGDSLISTLGEAEMGTILESLPGAETHKYRDLGHLPVIISGLMIGSQGPSRSIIPDNMRIYIDTNALGNRFDNLDLLQGRIRKNPIDLSFFSDTRGKDGAEMLNIFSTRLDSLERTINAVTSAVDTYLEGKSPRGTDLHNRGVALIAQYRKLVDNANAAYAVELDTVMANRAARDSLFIMNSTLQADMSMFFTELELTRAWIQRSPPPGNTHLDKLVFGLDTLNSINNIYQDLTGSGFNFFDDTRNKSLTLLNPISFITSNLGDFDGDTFSAIFFNYSQMKLQRDDMLERAKERREMASQAADPAKRTILEKQANDLDMRASALLDTIQQVNTNANWNEYTDSVYSWVAGYMKLDKGMLEQRGIEHALVLVEQSRGLFGMMEDVYARIQPAHEPLLELIQQSRTDNAVDIVNRLSTSTDQNILTDLVNNPDTGPFVRASLHDILSATGNDQEEKAYDFLHKLTAVNARDNLSKYMKRADGSVMSGGQFDMMQKVLGQAGSVILGKTYNTTVGMLYERSPIMAVSHALENSPALQDDMRRILIDQGMAGGMSASDANLEADSKIVDIQRLARQSRTEVGEVGTFLQEIQQMLRDAIKPKMGGAEFLENLSQYHKRFVDAVDDVERQRVVDDMSRLLPSITPLFKLDAYIGAHKELLASATNDAQDSKINDLLTKLSIGETEQLDLSRRLSVLRGDEIGTHSRALIASYQLRQDLVGMTAVFAFERAMPTDKAGNPISSGRGLAESVETYINSEPARAAQIDALIAGGITNGLTEMEIEVEEFQNFTRDVIGDKRFQDMGADTKRILAMNFLRSRESASLWANIDGSKLLRFAINDSTRSTLYGGQLEDVLGQDLITAAGDLTGSGASPLVRSLLQAVSAGKINEPEQVTRALESLMDTFTHADGKRYEIADIFSVLLNSGTPSPADKEIAEFIQKTVLTDETATSRLVTYVRATALGQQVDTADRLVEELRDYESRDVDTRYIKLLQDMGVAPDRAKELSARRRDYLLAGSPPDMDPLDPRPRPDRPLLRVADDLPILNNTAGNLMDVLLFPLLALAGDMISSGGARPEAMQQTMGNMLGAMAYVSAPAGNQMGRFAAGTLMSMGFKGRLAGQLHEDYTIGVGMLLAQEIAFGATAQLAGRYIINPFVEKTLGKAPTIDSDPFAGLRNVASNVITGALSLVSAGFVNKLLHRGLEVSMQRSVAPAALDAVSAGIRATQEAINQARMEREDNAETEVVDDAGSPVEFFVQTIFNGDEYDTYDALYMSDLTVDRPNSMAYRDESESYSMDLV